MNFSGSTGCYSFRLCDGSGWSISATSDASSFVDSIAEIFTLNQGNDVSDRYVFTRGLLPANLPSDGWSRQKLHTIELWRHKELSDVICKVTNDITPETEILSISYAVYPIYRKVVDNGGAPFHCALVERDGKAVILAARGDTGKSTCARRIPAPWKPLCDDEALAVKTSPNCYRVHPFPTWSNFIFDRPQKTWEVQHHAKLCGIFFIEQASIDEATPLGQGEGAMRIYGASMQVIGRVIQSLVPSEQEYLKKQLFANACDISKSVPSFSLKVLLDGKFWEEIERVLKI